MKHLYKEPTVREEIIALSAEFHKEYGMMPTIETADLSVFGHIKFTAILVNSEEEFFGEGTTEEGATLDLLKKHSSYTKTLRFFL